MKNPFGRSDTSANMAKKRLLGHLDQSGSSAETAKNRLIDYQQSNAKTQVEKINTSVHNTVEQSEHYKGISKEQMEQIRIHLEARQMSVADFIALGIPEAPESREDADMARFREIAQTYKWLISNQELINIFFQKRYFEDVSTSWDTEFDNVEWTLDIFNLLVDKGASYVIFENRKRFKDITIDKAFLISLASEKKQGNIVLDNLHLLTDIEKDTELAATLLMHADNYTFAAVAMGQFSELPVWIAELFPQESIKHIESFDEEAKKWIQKHTLSTEGDRQ